MSEFLLPLRQRKLLNYLQHASGFMTGRELAALLSVSSRTVRNDVAQINELLENYGVRIVSKHSAGYIIEAEDAKKLKTLTQTGESFISRSERLRYIAQKLCLSEVPIDLDELADEMFISKTTIEHDLVEFRKQYVLPEPHIRMTRTRNTVAFEPDERKRRRILCSLILNNWNYNGRGNSFYEYGFLHEQTVNTCMQQINYHLEKYAIAIEDINMVSLDLIVAVAYERIAAGHTLTDKRDSIYSREPAVSCTEELMDALETRLGCPFNQYEREEICELISCSLITGIDTVRAEGVNRFYSPALIRFVNDFLNGIKRAYGLDLFDNEDFYITLVMYLDYLSRPIHNLNSQGIVRKQAAFLYAVSMEMAMTIQPLALDFYGSYLNSIELIYLCSILGGAVSLMSVQKVRTVILSHYNHCVTWAIKSALVSHFSRHIEVTDLLSMYEKDNYDFTDTDLILCTANKAIASETDTNATQIRISPDFGSADIQHIEAFLEQTDMRRLYRKDFPDTLSLLDKADWYEDLAIDSYFAFLEFLGRQLIHAGYVDEDYLTDIFRREKVISFTSHPSFILVLSATPAHETQIVAGTLRHRINIDGNKLRTVFMLCTKEEDRSLIFKLYNDLYYSDFDPLDTRFFKHKEEYLEFFRTHPNTEGG